ncbi:DUF2345 domain-containing protein [Azonexus sp. IMCC34842]|uniref:DUF2345 domain-containing protein n=1 Tax=Azonexus sp. IMCC34842 TaxID=3420950 RepID=UPI003D0F018A
MRRSRRHRPAHPENHLLVAGKSLSIASNQDTNLIAQGNHSLATKDGIALFTVGKASGSKPNSEIGIHLHAASGQVSLQSQSGNTPGRTASMANACKATNVKPSDACLKQYQGEGTARTGAPGTTFRLVEYPKYDRDTLSTSIHDHHHDPRCQLCLPPEPINGGVLSEP